MQQTVKRIFNEFFRSNSPTDLSVEELAEPPLGTTVYVASALINTLALALPLTILQIYDRVLPNAAFETLSALITFLVGVILVDSVLKYLRSYLINWSAASFTHKLSKKAMSTMLASPSSNFSRTTASEHLERLNAVSGLGSHIGGQSRIVGVDVLFIPIFAAVIILVGGVVFFTVLVLFAAFGYLAMQRANQLNEIIEDRERHESRKYDFIIETLRAMQTVKTQAMEPLIMRRFERMQSAASVITRQLITLTGTTQTFHALYASLSVIMIVGVGALIVLDGRLTLGALACCMLLSSQLLQPLMRSLSAWNEIQLAKHRRERVNDIFEGTNTSEPIEVTSEGYDASGRPSAINFDNVTVQHGEAKPLFENLDLEIAAGAMIALRGADGSGRSSLLRLLMGDGEPTAGKIKFDGKEAATPAVRYIGPTPTTFRGTILDNLTLFGELPYESALWASKLIGLDDEVTRLPLGYDTLLKSSAGRDIPVAIAQRVCIARALATRPSVLILDEANALLDMSGERQLVNALNLLKGKITIILSTHRPSLIRLADKAYDIADGTIVPAQLADHFNKAVG
ncbi:MAG: toxin ABC transporter [Hyphococcus sp.]|nr:MAG: toxin ABC transporter [Marinicaulis sp.]